MNHAYLQLEQRLKPLEPGHVLECFERYPDGREVLIWTVPNSTASFSKIIINVPADSEQAESVPGELWGLDVGRLHRLESC